MHWEMIQLTQLLTNIYHAVKDEVFLRTSNTKISISDKGTVLHQKLVLLLVFLSFSLLYHNSGTTFPTFLLGSANEMS